MIAKAIFTVGLCIQVAMLPEIHALTLSFSESDVSVLEAERQAKMVVSKTGRSRGNITCTLIPLSVDEARVQFGYKLEPGNPDPAEIGLDFSPAPIEHVFEPGTIIVDQLLAIDVEDDEVYENEELFLVRLNITFDDPLDEAEVEVGIQFLTVRISMDSSDVSILRGRMSSTPVSEDAGLVEDFITVYKERESELPLSFILKVDVSSDVTAVLGDDYELDIGEFTLFPNESNLTFSLSVTEDVIAEGEESFTWLLIQDQTQKFLVQIIDNEVVTVRLGNSTELTVEEGDTVTLCAEIESPAEIDRQFFVFGNLRPGTADVSSDYVFSNMIFYSLDGSTRRSCQEIRTLNDELPETDEQFSLSLGTFPSDSLLVVQPDTITFTIQDNDDPELQVMLPANASLSEGVTLTEGDDDIITIIGPGSIPVMISITVFSDSTAEKGVDFEIELGNFTLTPGNSSLSLSLSILDDEFVENTEDWTLILSQPNSGDPPLNIIFTITDNDRVTVGVANDSRVSVEEGELVRVCGKLVNVTSSLLRREIVIESRTVPGTAEEGSDFVPTSQNLTFSSTSSDLLCVEVAVIDDSTPELTEAFSVTIQPVFPDSLISVETSSLEIIIDNDDVPQLKVEVLGSPSTNGGIISESDGTLDRLIRIFSPDGVHPFSINYTISTVPSSSDDFIAQVGVFVFSPADVEHFLSLTVLDDDIAEEDEEVSFIITVTGQPTDIITFIFSDNDDLRVGVVNDSEVSVMEGQTATVCAAISSPEEVDRSVLLLARTIPGTAIAREDYTPVSEILQLSGSQRITCFDINTLENNKAGLAREFKVQLEIRGQDHSLTLEQDIVTVQISDNDGIPLAPVITGVKLQESSTDKSYNLTISWEARQDEVRPIHIFTGSVVLTPLRHPVAVFDPSNVVYGFTVDNNTNEFTIVDVELAPFYRIEVCARNSLGFTCSDARFYAVVDGSITLIRDGVQEQRDSDLPAGVIVAIVMLVLFVILACCLGFICLLLFFCCCDEWRSYYPESREKKYKRDFERYRGEVEVDSDFDSDLGDSV